MEKYLGRLDTYPLPMDIALPVFNWHVWFRQMAYKGLIKDSDVASLPFSGNRYIFNRDSTMGSYSFEAGDMIRFEDSRPEAYKKRLDYWRKKCLKDSRLLYICITSIQPSFQNIRFMNLKKFSTACISSCLVVVLVAFPYNILGCGPDLNPYDYYTSFFRNGFSQHKTLQPFYYTNYRFLYDEQEPIPVKYVTSAEWTSYCGEPVKNIDAYPFVCQFAYKDLRNLYNHLEKNQPLQVPDSVKKNKMTGYFMQTKDLEALGYIMYAKQVEPYVTDEDWEVPNRDSVQMARLIKSGIQLYNAAGKEFIRYRYGYQVLRLYHYSGQYAACIKWYDEKMANSNVQSELNALSLSLKAGAMARTGKRKESVYAFSKLFAQTDVKKISNYMSFRFIINAKEDPQNYLALCRNSEERANMLAMMALGDPGDKQAVMTEIFRLAPQSPMLELLALREIHKWEDQYYSPKLSAQKGGSNFNTRWVNEEQRVPADQSEKLKSLSDLFHRIAQDKSVKTPALFETGAAYLQIMQGNWQAAGTLLASAEKMTMTPEMKDQWELTRLLLTINEKKLIDPAFETSILPSCNGSKKRPATKKDRKSITMKMANGNSSIVTC